MFWRKQFAILFIAVVVGCLVMGCRKEKEKPASRGAQRERAEAAMARARSDCERTFGDFLNALAVGDYGKALEFVDVEEMLEKGREKSMTSTAYSPSDAAEMKEKLRGMIESRAKLQKGELTHRIIGSEVSGDKAAVQAEVYNKGTLVKKQWYLLNKKGNQWKLSGSEAIRVLLPPMPGKESP